MSLGSSQVSFPSSPALDHTTGYSPFQTSAGLSRQDSPEPTLSVEPMPIACADSHPRQQTAQLLPAHLATCFSTLLSLLPEL